MLLLLLLLFQVTDITSGNKEQDDVSQKYPSEQCKTVDHHLKTHNNLQCDSEDGFNVRYGFVKHAFAYLSKHI